MFGVQAHVEDFAAGEVLYRSANTLVTRQSVSARGEGLIVKQAFGTEAVQRLAHEKSILERLAGVDGVVRVAHAASRADSLALHDDEGVPLSELLGRRRFSIADVVQLGRALARTLAGVHRAGVIHKDVTPSNVLIRAAGLQPILIDFNMSSSAAEEWPGFTHHCHLAGALRYMAPEQTGRTGRPVDQRADLYSLGALLYEMAVGRPPFEADDLLDLMHDHLVRVPASPAALRPELPPMLSDIVMLLLDKEPDRRYHTAEGLAQDLERVLAALRRAETAPFPLRQQDFARRLLPASRLIGRDRELAIMRQSLDHTIEGESGCLLVAGAPGVGKSVLINELRSMVSARRGWFVATRFDQYGQGGLEASVEVLRAMGRLLLAEPEDQLALHRARILQNLGANVGFGPALLPEFALLLGEQVHVKVADPREAEARMLQASLDLIRSVATPERPVVMVFDDLQWAPSISVRLLDALVTGADRIPGLLVVGVYRDAEVDAVHPLGRLMTHWGELGVAPPTMLLHALPCVDVGTLIGQMLRLPAAEADKLAAALHERTGGNPYDTVELVNALRQDGLLVARDGRWDWDTAVIRRYVGGAGVADIRRRRIARLPDGARDVLEILSCLGGEAGREVLALVADLDANGLDERLAPSLEDGLLVIESGAATVLRFSHDRVQQAVFEGMDQASRCRQHLRLARRLAPCIDMGHAAAEQYLAVADALVDQAERRRALGLFVRAADRSRVLNTAVAERFLAAAVKLLKLFEAPADAALLATLEVEWHAALYGLGRQQEGDAVYAAIAARCTDPIALVRPAGVQIISLISRGRQQDAMALGLTVLSALGLHRPEDPRPVIAAGLRELDKWRRGDDKLLDFTRPEAADPRVLACAALIAPTANAGYFADTSVFAWLILEAHRLWMAHGPCRQLLSGVCCVPFLLVGKAQDYRGAYVAGRHLLAVSEARGYPHGASLTRYVHAVTAGHWVEPIEDIVPEFRRAREGLLQAGNMAFGAYTYQAADLLFDCAPTLDAAAAETEAGLAFAKRVQHSDFTKRYRPRRQLIRALRGETQPAGSLSDADFDEDDYLQALGGPGTNAVVFHLVRALAAAIFGDAAALARHAARAMPMLARAPGYYLTAIARVLQALALAQKARGLPPDERAAVLEELDASCLRWLAPRAADAPQNFMHLLRWIEAERAWAAGDTWIAGAAFDRAMDEAARRQRPWHRALIMERAGLFHLAQGMEHSGGPLLTQACALYDAWGAAAKVGEMRREHPLLRAGGGLRHLRDGGNSANVTIDVLDMLAVLRASQALSSETGLARLTERLGKVLGALTGATAVRLLVRADDRQGWFLAGSLGEGEPVSADQAGARGELALSVFRYTERTRETLMLDDATRDDRFSGDPYIAGMELCSLLCAPILNHGELRAILMLESRLRRAAFSAETMDAIMLIAGQMSVSLDNALLYASLERKVAERTAALEQANSQLEQISRTDFLTRLPNRRSLNETLDVEWLRAKRGGASLGLVMIDIDFFKLYNDRYGHQGGDACLRRVADVLATGLRGGCDFVARYGGEEFVVVLPDTGFEGACEVAERMRAAVEALREPHAQSPFDIVTISAGVTAVVPGADSRPGQWIEQADAALYEAKRGGRNRVVRAIATTPD